MKKSSFDEIHESVKGFIIKCIKAYPYPIREDLYQDALIRLNKVILKHDPSRGVSIEQHFFSKLPVYLRDQSFKYLNSGCYTREICREGKNQEVHSLSSKSFGNDSTYELEDRYCLNSYFTKEDLIDLERVYSNDEMLKKAMPYILQGYPASEVAERLQVNHRKLLKKIKICGNILRGVDKTDLFKEIRPKASKNVLLSYALDLIIDTGVSVGVAAQMLSLSTSELTKEIHKLKLA